MLDLFCPLAGLEKTSVREFSVRPATILCMVVTIIFSHVFWAHAGTPSGIIKDFQFIQNGQVIQPNSGVVTLSRSTFAIRYRGKGTTPSIYAGFNQKLKQQIKELRDPVVSFAGTGSAASPAQLYVDSEALDFYHGWSAAFESAWGSVQDAKGRDEYVALRNRLATDPLIIMSGRNYANFEPQADGSHLFTVNSINDSLPPFKNITQLYLILFADETSAHPDASVYLLNWTPLTVNFSN